MNNKASVSFFLHLLLLPISIFCFGQSHHLPKQNDRWAIQPDRRIEWEIDDRLSHSDHIEMSGQKPTFRLLPVLTPLHTYLTLKSKGQ
jgi:hypothetical protein